MLKSPIENDKHWKMIKITGWHISPLWTLWVFCTLFIDLKISPWTSAMDLEGYTYVVVVIVAFFFTEKIQDFLLLPGVYHTDFHFHFSTI